MLLLRNAFSNVTGLHSAMSWDKEQSFSFIPRLRHSLTIINEVALAIVVSGGGSRRRVAHVQGMFSKRLPPLFFVNRKS